MKILGQHPRRWSSLVFILIAATGLSLALVTYNPSDPSFSTYADRWTSPSNLLGYLGSWLSDFLFQSIGLSAWLLPLFLVLFPVLSFLEKNEDEENSAPFSLGRLGGLCCLIMSLSLSLELILKTQISNSYPLQGVLGRVMGSLAKPFLGQAGSGLLAFFLFWAFLSFAWPTLPNLTAKLFIKCLALVVRLAFFMKKTFSSLLSSWKIPELNLTKNNHENDQKHVASSEEGAIIIRESYQAGDDEYEIDERESENEAPESGGIIAKIKKPFKQKAPVDDEIHASRPAPENWELPPLTLLKAGVRKIKGPSQNELIKTADKIVAALSSFDIEGEIQEISPGPIITSYEFQPAPGVRAQKIMSASIDLAMTLGAPSVRIVAPIPGKSVAGIEVPNAESLPVLLRDVIENTLKLADKMKLPLVLGKDAEGRDVIEDLSRMPHLLVGGATSMGKSVFVNSILTSLLTRFSPDELKLIIVDPKLVEFKVFEDIPHLLLPIVNDADDANKALKWAVKETKRRYQVLQEHGAKNIQSFNEKVERGDFEEHEDVIEAMPYIVIIIDELAELMLVAKKEVEQSIVRLTQLARAAGVHLVMATQRPSADVVTGLIKSNCPARASLRVASASDSRIILDCGSAEQLIGRGDLFFTNTGPLGLRRMQGSYVGDDEIERVCDFWREQGDPDYQDKILMEPEEDAPTAGDDVDKLYTDVVDFAKAKGKISTSLIQRRFQIGYTRAARIMEQLEERGIVSEQSSAGKARDVLV